MSTTTPHVDDSAPPAGTRPRGAGPRLTRAIAGVAAVAVLVLGARAIGASSSSTTSQTTNSGTPMSQGTRQMPPGMGPVVTGSTLTKLKAVATAKYPGTVEGALQQSDGSYVVHVIQSNGSGEVHVLVSKAF